MIDKKHIGTNFDSFLAEENILQEAEIIAKNRVNAYIIEQQAIRLLTTNFQITKIKKLHNYFLLQKELH